MRYSNSHGHGWEVANAMDKLMLMPCHGQGEADVLDVDSSLEHMKI